MSFRRLVAAVMAVALAAVLSVGPAYAAKPAPAGKVNLNTATVEQLESLPGVGPKLAARILEHREKAGSFKSVEELMVVKGIGEKNFKKLEGYVTLGDQPRSR
jgi:competence protein ComEA